MQIKQDLFKGRDRKVQKTKTNETKPTLQEPFQQRGTIPIDISAAWHESYRFTSIS
jgi:hypothetical protein